MFEKEAEEYAGKVYGNSTEIDYYGIADAFKDGAEFGYNKAKKEMEEDDNSCETCRHKAKMLTDKKPCKDCDNGCNWEK